MSGLRIPRPLLITVTLGVAVAGIMLSLFYVQYRWLATEIVAASFDEYQVLLETSFERRARAELHAVADALPAGADDSEMRAAMALAIANNETLAGLRLTTASGQTIQSGDTIEGNATAAGSWLADRLQIVYPLERQGRKLGDVTGSFLLTPLQRELDTFRAQLESREYESRKVSAAWIGAGTIVVLLLCAGVLAVSSREQTRRIRALKLQAEKIRDSDFGERLDESRDDELGALASVFNDMRDTLRTTTHSRNYVDRLLSGMSESVIVTSDEGVITRVNPATLHLLGFEEDELLGKSIDFLINSQKSRSLANDTPSGLPREVMFESKFGESIPVSYTCSVVRGDDGTNSRIYAAQNITERRRAEKRIRYLARIDPLTKIPNRMQFQHLLQRGIARARRAGKPLCMFYLDIDRFKEINDTFGHLAGDTTLETVAERLTTALPPRSVIGRLAGDEFAVIVEGLGPDGDERKKTGKLAQRLLDRLADPFFVQGHEVFMTASLGIAYYPDDAGDVIDLIRNADAALYSAKKNGGNVHAFYVPKMNEDSIDRLMTKSKLKRAFERDELLVHYQPKYNLETGEVFGAEALVRWELPERGLILPSDFIPIAEETNLIIEIGEWVLDKVCEDFRFWQRSVSSPGRVSVNLSLKQLRQPNFIQRISSILRGHEVSPTSLELEITETTLMENTERTIRILDQLYGLGLHLAIDDFGTGYSSLSALQQFPISTLKIDKSFVRNVVNNPEDATIVDTVVQMGRNLKLDVVAEGVETEAQLNLLQKLGCTYAQGLLFGDPMSSDNYIELLLAQADGTDRYRALFG